MKNKMKRASPEQLETLLLAIEKMPSMQYARSTSSGSYGARKWQKLTKKLNSMGLQRTAKKWQQTLRDWKGNLRKKAERIEQDKAKTGHCTLPPLSNVEIRLLKLTGSADTKIPSPQIETMDAEERDALSSDRDFCTSDDDNLEIATATVKKGNACEQLVKRERHLWSLEKKRATPEQLEILLEEMERRPYLQNARMTTAEGFQHWETLVTRLNCVGVEKTSKKWKQAWRDWKANARKKAERIESEKARTGHSKVPPLTDMEIRLLKLTGPNDTKRSSTEIDQSNMDELKQESYDEESTSSEDAGQLFAPETPMECGPVVKREDSEGKQFKTKYKLNDFEKKRANSVQLEALLLEMERQPSMQSPRSTGWEDAQRWAELAARLNSLGEVKRSAQKWKRTWNDWKCNIRKKAARIENKKARAGRCALPPLSEMEKRVLSVVDFGLSSIEIESGNAEEPDPLSSDDDSGSDDDAAFVFTPEDVTTEFDEANPGVTVKRESSPKPRAEKKHATPQQQEMLLKEIEKRPSMQNPYSMTYEDSKHWEDLARRLNSIGTKKTAMMWKRTWSYWKSNTRKKARRIEEKDTAGPCQQPPLTDWEIRVLNFAKFRVQANEIDINNIEELDPLSSEEEPGYDENPMVFAPNAVTVYSLEERDPRLTVKPDAPVPPKDRTKMEQSSSGKIKRQRIEFRSFFHSERIQEQNSEILQRLTDLESARRQSEEESKRVLKQLCTAVQNNTEAIRGLRQVLENQTACLNKVFDSLEAKCANNNSNRLEDN